MLTKNRLPTDFRLNELYLYAAIIGGTQTLLERRHPMTMINQLRKVKGHGYVSVGPDETVYSALEKMAEKNIGSVLVMDGATLVGIFTERDYARNIVLKGRSSPQTLIREVMSTQVASIGPSDTVEECMALMTERCVRHLPVIEDEAVVGIISIGDLVKSTIDDQRFTIDQLETYCRGVYRH
jgi:CBS domain-containing protein